MHRPLPVGEVPSTLRAHVFEVLRASVRPIRYEALLDESARRATRHGWSRDEVGRAIVEMTKTGEVWAIDGQWQLPHRRVGYFL